MSTGSIPNTVAAIIASAAALLLLSQAVTAMHCRQDHRRYTKANADNEHGRLAATQVLVTGPPEIVKAGAGKP